MGFLEKWFPKNDVEERAIYNSESTTLSDGAFSLDSLFTTNAITEEKVLKIPSAKACVDLIAGSIAQMPVYLYKENSDGSIEKINDKRMKLLNHEANDFLNGYSLKRNMVKDYVLHGASYVSLVEAGNTVLELHPLPARSIVVNKRIQNGYKVVGADIVLSNSESGAFNQVKKKQMKFKPYELMIALQETHDGLTSKGAIVHGQELFRQALSEIEYTSNLYERGALPLGLLKTDSRMTENQATSLREAWRNLYGGIKNSAKTVVLQEGMSYEALSMNPQEIQMNETRRGTASEICKLFNVPESLVASQVGKQYVSIEQNNLHFLKSTLSPIINSLESAMDRALLLESEKNAGYFFRFDTAELVRATEKERVDTIVSAVSGGIYTINEGRSKLDLPAISEDILKLSIGDVMLNPETGDIKVPNVEGENSNGKPTKQDGNSDN
ncbi:phage portal protein [Halalkalibacter kiskunsagensis]|uniref:Phage portal protein n=1 Tax=Halalkalibacter kiskunsagensis TaxID=1548599 RepID=A0ABV6K9D7_9BACI